MAVKKKPELDPVVENMKNISEMFRETLAIVNIDDIKIIDKLEGDEQRDFCKFAHQLFYSPYFSLIMQNFVFAQAMLVTEKGWDAQLYSNGQMAINGVQAFRELIWKHANLYDTKYNQRTPDFDPHKSFEPGQVR
jgi:vancomycin permeability regulator SanA